MTREMYHIKPGVAHPLGAVPDAHGVNFSLFSKHATSVELLLFAFTIWGLSHDDDLHVMLNMEQMALDFEIPSLQEKRWLKVIDTDLPSPMDFVEPGREMVIPGGICHVSERSVVVLISG